MSEILNLEAIEQQRILITVSLTGSDGAPVNPSDYVICAAAIGQPNPYTQRAVRKEWAASINNENSAFLLTCPGLDIDGAPWKYRILLKNRALELEWQIVSGRISLTPRACGTDGISPAAYSVACEATPSGLVNVTLDATVGSITTTLEQVKASAAAAAAAAQNAHADLEDAETAATKASQAALAAASDARIASEKATAAEAAATAAPEACAPYVTQVQQAAAQALDASRAATTAAADAQASADAAAPAQGYATRAEEAKTAAVQAAGEATAAATTATQQAESATAQAESARLAATTASTASDNAQQAATRAEDAATRADAAAPAATRAEAARDAAEAAAATATTAAAYVPGLVQRAETAATASEAAQTASETAQSTAETAAATATAQAEAASASATQADTDARAVAILVPRAEAAQQAAANSATAAAASEAAAAASATAAAASAQELLDEELGRMVDLAAATYGIMEMAGITSGAYLSEVDSNTGVPRIYAVANGAQRRASIVVSNSSSYNPAIGSNWARVLYVPKAAMITGDYKYLLAKGKKDYVHAPNVQKAERFIPEYDKDITVIFSPDTKFEHLIYANSMFRSIYISSIVFAPGTTFSNVVQAGGMFYGTRMDTLPDEFTFRSVRLSYVMFYSSSITKLPAAMELPSLTDGREMFYRCTSLEIDDLVRVCLTINDLQALETPTTGQLGLPASCKHNGETVDTQAWLNANHPDFLVTLNARGWSFTFA